MPRNHAKLESLPGQSKAVEYVPGDNIEQIVLCTWKFIATKFISGTVKKKGVRDGDLYNHLKNGGRVFLRV